MLGNCDSRVTNARHSVYYLRKRWINCRRWLIVRRLWCKRLFDLVRRRRMAFYIFLLFPSHFSAFLLVGEFSYQVLATFRVPKSLRNFLTSAKAPFRHAVYTYKKKQNYDQPRLHGESEAAITHYCCLPF